MDGFDGGDVPEVTLEELAERPGSAGDVARELLAIRADRLARLERERLAAEAEAKLTKDTHDWSDPAFRDGLRAQVEVDRARASREHLAGYEELLRRQGWDAETVRIRMADARRDAAAADDLVAGRDALYDHPAYVYEARRRTEQARAEAIAREGRLGYGEDLAEAEAAIASVKAKVLAGGVR